MRTVDLLPPIAVAVVVGGIAVLLSGRRELIRRWCAWAVAIPVIVGAFLLGPLATAVLVAAVGAVCVAEYSRLTASSATDRALVTIVVIGLVAAAWAVPQEVPRLAAGGALAVVAGPVLEGDAAHGFRRAASSLLAVAWFTPLAVVVSLGPAALALLVAVSIADIAAYFGGRRLGGPMLSPLSPAKRWSGVLVGAAAGLGTLALLGAFSLPLAIGVAVGGPLGDLIESMVKRATGVKDAGTWLPGSGGLLDRVDSLLLALAVTAVLGW